MWLSIFLFHNVSVGTLIFKVLVWESTCVVLWYLSLKLLLEIFLSLQFSFYCQHQWDII